MIKKQTRNLKKAGAKAVITSLKDQKKKKGDGRNKNSTQFKTDAALPEEKGDIDNEILGRKWYEEFPQNFSEFDQMEQPVMEALRKEAGSIFEKEITSNRGKAPKTISKSDYNWINTVISKGTVSDKIAAYVLLVQDNPIVNMSYLRNMVSMAKVGKKRECFMTMDTLVELFLEDLLPPARKLKLFVQQPLSKINTITSGNAEARRRLLLLWFFEDHLKKVYTTFLQALNEAAHDSVEANKEKVVVIMHKLLQGHPEQEATLLSNIVNKLGDPSHKIGSKVIYTLTKLLDVHPSMKGVVLEEVEKVIFRSNMSKRAQYYSVCFLSQFTFESSDSALANNAISIYFALFKACIKTGEIDSRMMSALLTGVSRAYPFAKNDCAILREHINTVYKVVHLGSAKVAVNALSILFLVVGDSLTDRFMTALFKKVGEPAMFCGAHHAMFLSIIFKSLKRDTDDGRVCAFIKRLLQVSVYLSVPLICGILILISHITHGRKKLNLKMVWEPKILVKLEEEDAELQNEEEHYQDCDANDIKSKITIGGEETVQTEPAGSWYHVAMKQGQSDSKTETYDPYQRNPLHAQGNLALPVELTLLAKHFHPTVSLFSNKILQGSKISYSGDPLQDFTLIRFLDKFVFKNPKKVKPVGEQVTTFARFGRKKYYASVGLKRLRVNSEEYLKNNESIIPVDETYLYRYLKEKGASEKKKIVKDEDDSDVESIGDEEFDAILKNVSASEKDDLDFMSEIGNLPGEKQKAEQEDISDEDEDDDDQDDDGELSDSNDLEDTFDGEDMSDFGSDAEDFDDGEFDLSDDGDLESDLDEQPPSKKVKKVTKQTSKSARLFASAEEFSEILEDDQYQAGSSSALSSKDNADLKQLKWESNRDRWMKGKNYSKRSKDFHKYNDNRKHNQSSNKQKNSFKKQSLKKTEKN